ncbi:MAG: von Willebrand factor type A domain-containing protein [Verrucomicrobiota bacterium]|nr:von Willebrand factor type A domain-containing protein [Verrucomicrobiota bacterium]
MKINLDDPNLTAFALDELSGAERNAMAQAVASSPEAQAFVAETQQLARLLKSEYVADRQLPPERTSHVAVMAEQRRRWSWNQWGSLAAALAIFAVLSVVAVGTIRRELGRTVSQAPTKERKAPGKGDTNIVEAIISEPTVEPQKVPAPRDLLALQPPAPPRDLVALQPPAPPPPSSVPEFVEEQPRSAAKTMHAMKKRSFAGAGKLGETALSYVPMPSVLATPAESEVPGRYRQDFDTATYDHITENPFLPAATNPLSTFSIDVDTASYSNVRRFINDGTLPPKDAVRVEEMINYFTYDYREPEADKPFSIDLDATACPWDPSHRLLRIGLKAREVANENRPASNLVFLLDVSGSMTPAERLPLVKQAMRLLVDKLTEKDRVAIVIYAGGSGLALQSTTGDRKETILRALEELKAGGSTNGAEGIELAYKVAADNFIKGGVNRVILATDGDFNVGVTNQGDLIRLIETKAKSGVFLSVLGVGKDNLKDSTMQKLADKGNGNYAYLDSIDEARKVLVQQINGTLMTVAKDVKIQVEFNPARVASYRLIGYEKRMLRKEDFKDDKVDAGEIGAGHTVTALYEVVPAGTGATAPAASVPAVDPLKYQTSGTVPSTTAQVDPKASQEMVTVKLRHKKPDGEVSELTERSFVDNGSRFENAAPDLKFAAAVAEFGMILRDSQFKGKGTIGAVIEWALEGKGPDTAGYRAGFIELARRTQKLKPSEG